MGCLASPNGASGAPGNLASSAHLLRTLTPKAPSGHNGPRPTWPRTLGPAAFEGTALPWSYSQQQRGAVIHRRARDCLRAPAALPRSIRRMAHVKGLCEPPAVLFDEAALRTTLSAARASQAASYFSIVFKETLKPSSECGQAFRHGAS